MLQASPSDAFLLFATAKEYEKMGDKPQALAFYERLQTSDPNYTGLYYHLGKLHEQLEQPEQAIQAYKTGIEVCRKAGDRHAMSELAAALLNLEDPEE